MYKVNLLPPELLAIGEPGLRRRSPLYNLLLLAAGGLCLLYLAFLTYLFVGQVQIEAKRKALAALEPQIQQVERLQQQTQILRTRAAVWGELIRRRREYYPLLADLQRVLPVDMWLTRVALLPEQPQPPETTLPKPTTELRVPPLPNLLVVEGGTHSLASVGVYVNNLCQLPHFKRVALKEVKRVGQEQVTTFTIEAVLGGR